MRCSVGKILRPPVLTRSVGAIPQAKSDGVGKGARGRRILPSAVPGAFAHLTRCGNVQRVMPMAPEKTCRSSSQQNRRSRRGPGLQIAMGLLGILEGIPLIDRDLHFAARNHVEGLGRELEEILTLGRI